MDGGNEFLWENTLLKSDVVKVGNPKSEKNCSKTHITAPSGNSCRYVRLMIHCLEKRSHPRATILFLAWNTQRDNGK